MENCLFCKIVKGEIPIEKVYEDDDVLGFKDIAPMAPIHLLFIHKEHTANMVELVDFHEDHLLPLFKAVTNYAKEQKFVEGGFRIVSNIGPDAGQSVFHTHLHLLSGDRLGKFGN